MERKCYNNLIMKELKPVMVMVLVQMAYAGMTILYKMADEDGMNLEVLVSYRMMFASAFMIPFALVVERRSRPPLTWFILFQAFVCGLLGGTLAQNLFIEGLALTSATFAAAMTNLMPAIAFIMAILFGLEKLALGTLVGKAKVIGTAIGIGGAMVFTFYRGAVIQLWSTHVDLLHHPTDEHVASSARGLSRMILGAFLCFCSGFSFVLWLIVQTKMSKKYPCYYSSTALMSVMASVQSVVFALCLERDWSQWKLGWNIRLLATAYSGILTSGLVVALISWCSHLKGPLFVSIFNPLCLIIVALASSLVLQEKLHLGRKSLSEVNGKVLFQAFLCGLFGGSLQQNLYVEALALVSATYATTMLNLIPAVTFIMAVSLRLEKANLGTPAGKAKVIGTFTGIGGAMILTFYKGTRIYLWSTHFDLVHHVASSHGATASRLLGCMLALGTCMSYCG